MIVFPAIDIKDGKCVRLTQGDFNLVETFSTDPAKTAKEWESQGGEYLHVVDLDGALKGCPVNLDAIKKIVNSVQIPVQFGGGIRNEESIMEMLNLGVTRVILGTSALSDKQFTKSMIEKYKDQIVVSIDAKEGKVAVRGWTEVSEIKAIDLADELTSFGLKTIVYTDIAKDGMLSGPNFAELAHMNQISKNIIASGGISSSDDLEKLKQMKLYGAIIGKALYTGAIRISDVKDNMEE